MLNEQTIYCPLVKREISCVDCMETEYRKNADIIEELGGLEEFEKKYREICDKHIEEMGT